MELVSTHSRKILVRSPVVTDRSENRERPEPPVYLQQRVIQLSAQLLSQTFSAPINMHRVTTCAQKDRYTGLRAKRKVLIFNRLTKIYSAVLALLHFSEATKPLSTYLQY